MTETPPPRAAGDAPPRRRARTETGATTAEYVGILAAVAVVVVGVIGIATPVFSQASSTVSQAICRIGEAVGVGGGCAPSVPPPHVPTKCTVTTDSHSEGGSATVIVKAGGDSGYTISEVRVRQPDGTIKTQYVYKTQGKVGLGYEFKGGAGVEVNTGKGGGKAKAGVSGQIGLGGSFGHQYTFDTLDEAMAAAERYGGNFGQELGDGAPKPDFSYWEASAQGGVKGEVGPLDNLSGNAAVALGAESYPNGDTKVKMALTMSGAAELGIPLPTDLVKATADGKVSGVFTTDVTFDKNGTVVAIGGSFVGTASAGAGVDVGPGAGKKPGTDNGLDPSTDLPTGSGQGMGDLALKDKLEAGLQGGKQVQFSFSNSFRNPDGTIDHSAVDALSEGLGNFVTNGEGLTPEQQQAVADQLAESQVTLSFYDYNEDEAKYGGSIGAGPVKIGGEYHVVDTSTDLDSSQYYDPTTGQWKENLVCAG